MGGLRFSLGNAREDVKGGGYYRQLTYPPRISTLSEDALVEELHAAGKKVMVWTVNHADEMRRLAEWGVDAIISDETEAAVRTLGR